MASIELTDDTLLVYIESLDGWLQVQRTKADELQSQLAALEHSIAKVQAEKERLQRLSRHEDKGASKSAVHGPARAAVRSITGSAPKPPRGRPKGKRLRQPPQTATAPLGGFRLQIPELPPEVTVATKAVK